VAAAVTIGGRFFCVEEVVKVDVEEDANESAATAEVE
jgi:hypothetical protein